LTALAAPEPEVLSNGVDAKSMRIENSHSMRFIEMYLAAIDPRTGDTSPRANTCSGKRLGNNR
jgi:hypothetical protein